ncbi:hypothetical protein B0H12DRAFT_1323897 [Mycena haematopus]|nr:hypothetical protein B0H12DRAFT_1323897 [Mycena haematopus]
MYPQSFLLDPRQVVDPFYHVNDSASTSLSFRHIFQPQPIRPIPRSLAREGDWRALASQGDDRTHLDEDSFGTTYFPDPENTLGLFSTHTKYSITPSRHPRHLPTPSTRRRIQDYEREGGWSFDATGRTHYVPHGGIMAVDEDEENLDITQDSHTFLDQQLPPDTTPPPRPRQRPVELIPLPLLDGLPLGSPGNEPNPLIRPPSPFRDFSISFRSHDRLVEDPRIFPDEPSDTASPYAGPPIDRPPLGDESNTHISPPPPRSSRLNDNCPTNHPTRSPLTRSQEADVVDKALLSIMTASLEIVSLHARFGALPKPNAADGTLCHRVGETLHAVEESLRRHRVVPAEQWSLRNVSSRRKYDYRLTSLQRTLGRLHNLSIVSPRVNQVPRVCKLLEQHRAKLSDLATKFNRMFDRLNDRLFHSFLSGVCADYQRGVTARKEDRQAARSARLGLYEYAFHRQRRPSMVGMS